MPPMELRSVFVFSSRGRHTRWNCGWSSDVCSSELRYDSGNYPECLRSVVEAIGWSSFEKERERARAEGRAIGLGVALFVEDTGLGPYEGIRVRVDPDRSEERRVGKGCRSGRGPVLR